MADLRSALPDTFLEDYLLLECLVGKEFFFPYAGGLRN
jgi:hypothetical protein